MNKSDGKPVPDAKVLVDSLGLEARKFELDYGWPHDGRTDPAGRFVHNYTISPYPSENPAWYLKVSKDGFEPVVSDIKPTPQPPKNDQGPIPLPVTVELQPKGEPLR